ncbi:hypothetical protein Q427_20230 [Halomonas sp. BC04]|nr:hypothetical protein Q427_20230 [Halomonas sp. BC04]
MLLESILALNLFLRKHTLYSPHNLVLIKGMRFIVRYIKLLILLESLLEHVMWKFALQRMARYISLSWLPEWVDGDMN